MGFVLGLTASSLSTWPLYLAKVDAAGGWKRYAQAHTARLAPIFAKVFPHARLPPELVSHIVGLWAHVGYY